MGGLFLRSPDYPEGFPITAEELHYLVKYDHVDFPDMESMRVDKADTADTLSRVLTVLQVIWFSVGQLSRIHKGFPMTTLELTALSFVSVTIFTSACWYRKPTIGQPRRTLTSTKRNGTEHLFILSMKHRLWDRVPPYAWEPAHPIFLPLALLVAFGFGASFLSAWNFYFPTDTEKLLWRIFASYHAFFCVQGGLYYAFDICRWHQRNNAKYENRQHVENERAENTAMPNDLETAIPQISPRLKQRIANRLHRWAMKWRNSSADQDPDMAIPLRVSVPIPGVKAESSGASVTPVARSATGSNPRISRSSTSHNVKVEPPISVKSEPQSDREASNQSATRNVAAAVYSDADDFSDDDDLSFKLATPAQRKTQPSTPKTTRAPRPKGPKGSARVCFKYEKEWQEKRVEWLGHATREISFWDVLTPAHIDTLLSFTETCERLTKFSFTLHDVDSGTTNSATELTDDDIVKIAQACPKLKTFDLPGARGLTEKSFLALCEHCPDLTHLHISNATRNGWITGHDKVFEALTERPELAPKLKELRIADCSFTKKVLRVFSKTRPKVHIILMTVSEVKKWGDWEIERYQSEWWRGKCQDMDGVVKREQRKFGRNFKFW
ncbi:hypothetical protein CcaCcLH18_10722 [Colletotrichum camelliae]|nr:hypothetical protein CcaCcLH18_10722 [Colletotrichum camelliae]